MSRENVAVDEQSCAQILELLPDGVVVVGADRCVEFVNPRAVKLIGRPPEDLVGRPVVEALPLLDGGGRSWWTCVDPWGGLDLRTGHRERMLHLPGRGHVLVTMSFLREGRRGPVSQVLVALRDTDARRRAEAAHAELLTTVAHELRSPLSSVKGFSGTLLQRWDRFSDDQKHLMVETIAADADRLARLIHELLDVSRLDTARLRLHRGEVDLRDLVDRHIARLVASGLDPSRFVRAGRARPHEPAPLVWADADRLDQVVANLLENAVRHGAGSVSVSIDPVQDRCGPTWSVSVADEGEGIPPEHYELVFTRFWHGARRGSTGLGLYLSRGLVEAHGGAISVDRAPGGGALFTFTVPSSRRG